MKHKGIKDMNKIKKYISLLKWTIIYWGRGYSILDSFYEAKYLVYNFRNLK